VTVKVRGVSMITAVGSVGVVGDGTDTNGTGRRVSVRTPAGSQSEAVVRDGDVRLDVATRGDIGRRGEPRLVSVLLEALKNSGHNVGVTEGEDRRGEDARLIFDGQPLLMQAVTVPIAREFWQTASVASSSTQVSYERAAQWIREAVEKKALSLGPGSRRQTLLALDANHAGVLATPEVVSAYRARHRSPCEEFGFAGVWIVGPTASLTTCLTTAHAEGAG
jgi:hypothetical protein